MSDPKSDSSDFAPPPEPGLSHQTMTFLGVLGSLSLFAMVLWIAYLPNRADDPLATTTEQRLLILQEAEGASAADINTLEVVDATNGVYKIPLDSAMEATLKAYQQKQSNP